MNALQKAYMLGIFVLTEIRKAEVPVSLVVLPGVMPQFQEAHTDGNKFRLNDGTLLLVRNGSLVNITVTIEAQRSCGLGRINDIEIAVPAGEERVIGAFNLHRFRDDYYANISYSSVSGVTVAAITI